MITYTIKYILRDRVEKFKALPRYGTEKTCIGGIFDRLRTFPFVFGNGNPVSTMISTQSIQFAMRAQPPSLVRGKPSRSFRGFQTLPLFWSYLLPRAYRGVLFFQAIMLRTRNSKAVHYEFLAT
jgi:hypothetical protein